MKEEGPCLQTKAEEKHQTWGSNYSCCLLATDCGFSVPSERTQSNRCSLLMIPVFISPTAPVQTKNGDPDTSRTIYTTPVCSFWLACGGVYIGVQLNPCVLHSECPSSVHTLWPSQRTAAFNTGPVFKRTLSWVWQTGETSRETDRCLIIYSGIHSHIHIVQVNQFFPQSYILLVLLLLGVRNECYVINPVVCWKWDIPREVLLYSQIAKQNQGLFMNVWKPF